MTNADPTGSWIIAITMGLFILSSKIYFALRTIGETPEKTPQSEKERIKALFKADKERLGIVDAVEVEKSEWINLSIVSDSNDASDVYPAFVKEPVIEKKPVENESDDLEEWQEVKYK